MIISCKSAMEKRTRGACSAMVASFAAVPCALSTSENRISAVMPIAI
jgi:hypothetical protein